MKCSRCNLEAEELCEFDLCAECHAYMGKRIEELGTTLGNRIKELRDDARSLLDNRTCSCGGWTCDRCLLAVKMMLESIKKSEGD